MNNHKILKYSYWLSIICLIHCISFPIIIAILPFIDIVFEINTWLEFAIILSVIVFGSYSLIHAYKTHHQNIKPLVIFFIGIAISVYIHFIAHDTHAGHNRTNYLSTFIEILSGVIIAGAQFYNLKITPKTCSHSGPHNH